MSIFPGLRRCALVGVTLFLAWLGAGDALAQPLNPSGEVGVRDGTGRPVAPGVYLATASHSGRCLGVAGISLGLAPTRVPFLAQIDCPAAALGATFVVGQLELVADTMGGYSVWPAGAGGCATVARGVILGPASIDVLPCGASRGAPAAADQRMSLRVIEAGAAGPLVEIRTPNGECWDVRDSSRDVGAELIRYRCNGQANQRFRLTFLNVPTRPSTLASAVAADWYPQRSPPAMISISETHRVNFYGSDYASVRGLGVGGCKARCADELRCRAFSLVRAGVQDPVHTVCWLKDAIPPPNVDPNVVSAIVRPAP